VSLFYIQQGAGIPLVLLHGFPFDHTIWEPVIGKLNHGIHIIAPDLRGHGRSKSTHSGYSMRDMASDVIQILDQLHIKNAVIAGHSMGGYVALEISRTFPERVLGLILVSAHIYADTITKKQSRIESVDKMKQQGAAVVLDKLAEVLTHNEMIKVFCRNAAIHIDVFGAVGAQYAMANRASSEEIWKTSENPTMVIAGIDDQIIPIEKSRSFALLPKNNYLVEIKDAGHMPMLEAPDEVSKALNQFINDNWRK